MRIKVKRDNDRNLKITVTKNNTTQNITGWTFYFTVKKTPDLTDSEAIIDKTITTHTDPTNGITTIPILAAETKDKAVGNYAFDIKVVDNTGKKQSSETGVFELVQEISDGA